MNTIITEIPEIKDSRLTLRALTPDDAAALGELKDNPAVYRYLPTFLYEKQNDDNSYVIRHLYDECLRDSLILGIYINETTDTSAGEISATKTDAATEHLANSSLCSQGNGTFCGLIEVYGCRRHLRKVSIGYRLLECCWGQGIATQAVSLLIDYLYNVADIRIITASTMLENKASANVLRKNGFHRIAHGIPEDWGYDTLTITDKWIRLKPRPDC